MASRNWDDTGLTDGDTISTTEWEDMAQNNIIPAMAFTTAPSTVITAGTNLTWSGNTLNATAGSVASSDIVASDTSGFDSSVSANSDVAANTGARHDAVTVTDGETINFTLTGQDITAEVISSALDTSDFVNSAGFITSNDVSAVGLSGSYSDLLGTPDIASSTSELVNDSGFITSSSLHDSVTITGQDFLSIDGQEITANAINLDNLSASGTASSTTYLRGDNTWAEVASGGLSDVVSDTTPQLGGDLDLNDKSFTREEVAGEALSSGDVCYLKSDGKYWKADASAESSASQDLLIAVENISADATGTFLMPLGELTTSGLTAGAKYYVSETAGAFTSTAPSTSGAIVRIVGTALSTTVLKFNPSVSYVELS